MPLPLFRTGQFLRVLKAEQPCFFPCVSVCVSPDVRVQRYEYRFTLLDVSPSSSVSSLPLDAWHWDPDDSSIEIGQWWTRRLVDANYIPPVEARNPSVSQFLASHGLDR